MNPTIESKAAKALGATAIAGAILLSVGTYLHPSDADPAVALEAFTEYASDTHWVASHLMQLFGVVLALAVVAIVSRRMIDGPAGDLATAAMIGAIASIAVACALQAVDGVALKMMVSAWSAAPEADKGAIFQAAFGVRQIEVGLASMLSLVSGITIAIFGVAMVLDRWFPQWHGGLAIAGGSGTAVAGVAMAYTGFSNLTMMINMPSNALLILWMVLLGIFFWRRLGNSA